MSPKHVVVVGAGASGTIQALHLVRSGIDRVTLVERERVPGRGTAYGTTRPEHLLNVPARRMSVWPDDPMEFARFVGDAEAYAPRMVFGDYLSGLLDAQRERIAVVSGEAVDGGPEGDGVAVRLADGRKIAADHLILALGNLRPALFPALVAAGEGPFRVDDPWHGAFAKGLSGDDLVLLVGTGLTAIDAALTIDAEGSGARILALSRRGLVPRASLKRDANADPRQDYPSRAIDLLRLVRQRSREIGWREAVHEVRQRVQAIWAAAPEDQRRRFVRHLRPYWDVHRHRIAPAVAARIDHMVAADRLRFAAGRIVSIEAEGAKARVHFRPRGAGQIVETIAARIVNCTGPELDIRRAGEPLLDRLVAAGAIRPDACRLGIDVDPDSRVIDAGGAASERMTAIGPMTRGAFWETIAVSDISRQSASVARRLQEQGA